MHTFCPWEAQAAPSHVGLPVQAIRARVPLPAQRERARRLPRAPGRGGPAALAAAAGGSAPGDRPASRPVAQLGRVSTLQLPALCTQDMYNRSGPPPGTKVTLSRPIRQLYKNPPLDPCEFAAVGGACINGPAMWRLPGTMQACAYLPTCNPVTPRTSAPAAGR